MADDVGIEAFGSYGGKSYRTPHLDALAAQSTRFLNAYPSIPKCLGSRTSVMMGMRRGFWIRFAQQIFPPATWMYAPAGFGSVIVGTLYALVDGLIVGAIFAWLYNRLLGKREA